MGLLNAKNDVIEWIRRTLIPPLGKLVSAYNESTGSKLYVQAVSLDREFVGRVEMSEEEFEVELDKMGFERNPLASLKRIIGTREKEEGSFRWIPPADSDLNRDFQLHVIIYDGKVIPDADTGETYIYAHWERRWDMNPLKHYKGIGFNPEKGVSMMKEKLTENNIEFDNTLPPTKQ